MRFRGKSIRRKIVALMLVPLISLTALWGFATVLTGQEASELLKASSVAEEIGEPVADALHDIQEERRQTLIYLADRRASGALPALRETRVATDRAVARITRNAAKPDVRDDLRSDTERKLTSLMEGLDGLIALRRSVESAAVSRGEALEFYNRIVDPGFGFLTTLQALHDEEMERQGRGLVGLSRAMELLSREDALIASALATGKVSSKEVRQLSDFVANRELYYELNLEAMPAKERAVYLQLWRSPETKPLRDAEERLIEEGSVRDASEAEAKEWQSAATPVLDELRETAKASGERYQDRVAPAAYNVFILAGVAGVVGFLALLVSIVVSVRIGSALIRDLTRLRKEAHEVSGVRLPSVMRRLAGGETVDVETEAPRLEYDKDEIGQAGQALNTLQRAAVEAAVRQADMRRGVSEVFVNLARRNQVLLHRQLTLLDAMERRTEDTDELADLFRLDHLTTRMRRHAEGLVILSGAAPSRQWRKPIQLMDIVRAAVAEVEDYERIEVRRLPRIGVGGPAVADLTHLIAELLENATVFSPPHTAVQVHGERVANGFTLEIHDRGLGMAPELLLDANLRLAETPEFELSDTDRLGLFVVSRLAQRQNVRVSLQPSPYGGTTAIVFIPAALLTDAPETRGVGFRLDRKSDAQAGRRGGDGKLTALSALSGPGRRNLPALFDGQADLEGAADLGPLGTHHGGNVRGDGLVGAGGGHDSRDPFAGFPNLSESDRSESEVGDFGDNGGDNSGMFRPRARGSRRAISDEQHQQALDPAPERTSETVPLPRRKPPTLVTDHGRRVDDQGRTHPAATSARAEEPLRAYRTDTSHPGAQGTSPARIDGLPRRVRQASLAPQLRENAAAERTPARETAREVERDAEEVRNRMASMQRGWQRGRLRNAHGVDGAAQAGGNSPGQTAPRTTSEGDGR
ncbi:sensor histidine kinase [Streptomyces albipurpureus]|uniref:histidine kinase n=1 Tax=Streptomyces albipurpureus TaxID=2897419 RepID=A0ABT0UY85_9ACTN|nr:nitrate- and nitrite sensing domain-containing protein [Streptomyces sp. CWNU-1]MCM2393435.1 nitrate- and nitrite sensing domain-containing protein [Streptomyces sp. CWNU-1]